MLELEKIPRENLVGPGSLSIMVCFLNLLPVGNQSVMGLDVVGLECCVTCSLIRFLCLLSRAQAQTEFHQVTQRQECEAVAGPGGTAVTRLELSLLSPDWSCPSAPHPHLLPFTM